MKIRQSLVLMCVCSLSSVACQTSTSKQAWDQAASGTPLSARDPTLLHTVAIVDPDPSIGQYCTGTVIDKRHVVTAAHCFEDKQRIPYVYMEKNFDAATPYSERGVLLRIELVAVHGQYQKARSVAYDKQILVDAKRLTPANPPLHDVAIALLENEVIPPYRPARLATGHEDLKTGRLFFAGYGCPGSDCGDSESELRKAEVQWVKNVDAYSVALAGRGNARTCAGDEGGPTYRLDPQGLVMVSIATSGVESCNSGLVVDTLIAPYKGWIEEGMKALARPMIQNAAYHIFDFTEKDAE